MDTTFWKNLIKGNKTEDKISNWLKARGFRTWVFGSYRLPLDILVWDKATSFWIQSKMRTSHLINISIGSNNYKKIRKETKRPVLLVLDYKDALYADYMDFLVLPKNKHDKTGFIFFNGLERAVTREDLIKEYEGEKQYCKERIIKLDNKIERLRDTTDEILLR